MKIKTSESMRRFNAAIEAADRALLFQADEVKNPNCLLSLLLWCEPERNYHIAKELMEAMHEIGI